jgi:CHAT domain-containing protein
LIKNRDLRGYYLHFATHSQAGGVDDTHLALFDGDLTLRDVWALWLDGSPLVVLSSCNSVGTSLLAGDEVVGLANGFLFAGAQSVVASVKAVPDAGTHQLMKKFYTHLAKHEDTAEALALAQREMIAAHYKPSDWAFFNVIGQSGFAQEVRKP